MSDEIDLTPAIFELDLRNKAAEAVIYAFAAEHAIIDIASGLLFGLVPGGGIAAVIAQLTYSAVRVYPEMVKKLAVIYGAEPDDFTSMVVAGGLVVEAGIDSLIAAVGPEVLGNIALDLTNEFGSEFFQEIIGELIQESSIAGTLSFIPVAGAIFGATLDAVLAATITWRVGAVVSAYFQYGGYIGSRKNTYDRVKRYVKRSARVSRPGTLKELRSDDQIKARQRGYARSQFRAFSGSLSVAQIRDILVNKQGIPADIVDPVAAEF